MGLIVVDESLDVMHEHVYELNAKDVLKTWFEKMFHKVALQDRIVSTNWV